MSYWDAPATGADHQYRYAATPLLHDIAVLQALYGVNTTTRAGDTVYGFNSTAGRAVFDFSVTSRPVAAIWDAGGIDEIDVSGFGMGNLVDLRAGCFSNVGGLIGNLAVAFGAVIENATGGAGVDTLIGNEVGNRLNGGGGADLMRGGLGDDVYVVDHTGDRVEELADHGDDTVMAGVSFSLAGSHVETLVLTGSDAIDATGNSLGNRLVGNSGANTLAGGGGDDVYVVQNAADVVSERAGEGVDTVESSVRHVLGDHVENLTLTGSGHIDGFGNELDNVLTGNRGRNTLSGGLGDDSYYLGAGDLVVELAGEGVDTVHVDVDFVLAANVENLTLIGVDAIDGVGNALSNVLTGNAGANVLSGGLGDDTYHIQNAQDRVVELAGQGRDRIYSSISFSLAGSYVEDLILTGAEPLNATGNSLANRLTGNAGANRLDGGAGADTLEGGQGDDIYVVDSRSDRVIERAGEGTDAVFSSVDLNLAGAYVENLTLTGTAKYGTGNSLDNILTGNASANVLSGGRGDDTYVIQGKQDRVVEKANEGIDTIVSSGDFTLLGLHVENLTLTGTARYGTGNAFDNVLVGNAAANALSGGAGNDTYVIQGKQDRVIEKAGEGIDTIISSGDFSLAGHHVENLTLAGTARYGTGNTLANVLTGNAAINLLSGGAGDDTYDVQTVGDRVIEKSGEGDDHVYASIDFSLAGQFVERLTLVGASSLAGTGNSLANIITGNDGANRIDGGAGADHLIGGRGDDVYMVDTVGDVIVELAGEGTDSVESARTYSLATLLAVENLVLTGSAAADGTGNDLDNQLVGNAGVNVLSGGKGNDSYLVQTLGDRVMEKAGEGRDHVRALISFDLAGSYVEDITLEGPGDLNAAGNSLDNVLTGNSGLNILSGRRGNDTYYVQTVGDRVIEAANEGDDHVHASVDFDLTGQHVERLTLVGDALRGVGNDLANRITGTAGGNLLDGGGGADTLIGGVGDDVYVVDHAGDRVVERDGEGHDRVDSAVSFSLAGVFVEDLNLTGTAAIGGTGNSLANRIIGNSGANTVSGVGGEDYLIGGAGRDVLRGGDGRDIIYGDAFGYTGLGAQLGHGADTLEGGDGDDLLVGGYGDDVLSGGAGDDILIGDQGSEASFRPDSIDFYWWIGGGAAEVYDGGEGLDAANLGYWGQSEAITLDMRDPDAVAVILRGGQASGSITGVEALTFYGGLGADQVTGGVGWASLYGGGGGDRLVGGSGGSTLGGEDGDDILVAGGGTTYFYGGGGADRYIFETGSRLGGARIEGYEAGEFIDLSGVDADASTSGDQAFRLVDAFTGKADEIVLDISAQQVRIQFDLDGDGHADQVVSVFTATRAVDLVL